MALNITEVNDGSIPYSNFETGQVMHDYLFDENNAALLDKINELITHLNNIKTTLPSIVDGDSGADNIGATAVGTLDGVTVQALLENLEEFIRTSTLGQLALPFYTGTIPITGWSTIEGDYVNEIDIAIEGITEGVTVIAMVDEDDSIVAGNAEFSTTVESYDGGITFKAKSIPTTTVGFRCFVVR